ncbi:hypothetical protein AGDE_05034 [Angomonas deanei]|nr:hypothetical protein AGDE_05034 [Angomonas deanei]|eukprot:EPY38895.1 hypothetical protein AGDE_05034 [Angomonas deanei]
MLLPFELRCVYLPTFLTATRAEARVGWGRLKEVIELETIQAEELKREGDGSARIVAVPWTAQHVVNLEASLIKAGFKVSRVFTIHWLEEDHMGEHFCSYYNYKK